MFVILKITINIICFFCKQGICTLEGEEHSDREKGPDPEPGAAHAWVPAQRTLAGAQTHDSAVYRDHH